MFIYIAASLLLIIVFGLGVFVGLAVAGNDPAKEAEAEIEEKYAEYNSLREELSQLFSDEFEKYNKRVVALNRDEEGQLDVKIGEVETVDDVIKQQLDPTADGEALGEAHKRNPESQVPDRGPSVIAPEEERILKERQPQRIPHQTKKDVDIDFGRDHYNVDDFGPNVVHPTAIETLIETSSTGERE